MERLHLSLRPDELLEGKSCIDGVLIASREAITIPSCKVVHNDRVLGPIMTLTVNSIGNQMVGRDLLAENGGQLLGVLLFVRACFLTILAR